MEVLAGNQRRDPTVMGLGKLEGGWRQKKKESLRVAGARDGLET